jgi:hypothetical protein
VRESGDDHPVRVLISYAHDDAEHEDRVRDFRRFLSRLEGIDAQLDLPVAERRQDWSEWTARELREAEYILVIASPEYKRRAEGNAPAGEGRGAQREARLPRDRFLGDQEDQLSRVLPVVLPGCSEQDIPVWLASAAATYYVVSDYTVQGATPLLRVLTGQPWETEPPLGPPPVLPSCDAAQAATPGEPDRETLVSDRAGEKVGDKSGPDASVGGDPPRSQVSGHRPPGPHQRRRTGTIVAWTVVALVLATAVAAYLAGPRRPGSPSSRSGTQGPLVPLPPDHVTAVAAAGSSARISWKNPAQRGAPKQVVISLGRGFTPRVVPDVSPQVITGLQPGVPYCFAVGYVYTLEGKVSYSRPPACMTVPLPPNG